MVAKPLNMDWKTNYPDIEKPRPRIEMTCPMRYCEVSGKASSATTLLLSTIFSSIKIIPCAHAHTQKSSNLTTLKERLCKKSFRDPMPQHLYHLTYKAFLLLILTFLKKSIYKYISSLITSKLSTLLLFDQVQSLLPFC